MNFRSVNKYNDQWQLLYSGVSGNNGDLYTTQPKEQAVSERPGSVHRQWNGFDSVHLHWGLERLLHLMAGPIADGPAKAKAQHVSPRC